AKRRLGPLRCSPKAAWVLSAAWGSGGGSAEDVVERDRLQIAASDDVEQLRVGVRDGWPVGVGQHDLLALKRLLCGADQLLFVDHARVADAGAPHRDRGVAEVGRDLVARGIVHSIRRTEKRSPVNPVGVAQEVLVALYLVGECVRTDA